MKSLRNTLTAIFCCVLLSFNTVAAALLAIDECMEQGQSDVHLMAEMQTHADCAGADQSWVSATAQLLCDQGGSCQMGGAVVPTAATLATAAFVYAPPLFTKLGVSPVYPTTFWRPPRH